MYIWKIIVDMIVSSCNVLKYILLNLVLILIIAIDDWEELWIVLLQYINLDSFMEIHL